MQYLPRCIAGVRPQARRSAIRAWLRACNLRTTCNKDYAAPVGSERPIFSCAGGGDAFEEGAALRACLNLSQRFQRPPRARARSGL